MDKADMNTCILVGAQRARHGVPGNEANPGSFMDMKLGVLDPALVEKMAEEILFCQDLRSWLAIYGPPVEEGVCLILEGDQYHESA